MWAKAPGTYAQSVFSKKIILETDAERVLLLIKFEVRASGLRKHRTGSVSQLKTSPGSLQKSLWDGPTPNKAGGQEKTKQVILCAPC